MTTTDPTLRGLLAGVLAAPDDDVPRLVLADWLEENGEPERAEFIRVQIQIWERREEPAKDVESLIARESELLEDNWREWVKPGLDPDHERVVCQNLYPRESLAGIAAEFRRGFVEAVSCDLATFMGGRCGRCEDGRIYDGIDSRRCKTCTPGIAPRLFASQPVQQITLSDVRPMRHRILAGHRYGYELRDDNARDAWQLPAELFQHLPKADFFVNDYRRWWWTEENALSALSAALVAYGRANAEGHRHGVCGTCKGEKRTDYWGPCPDCDATGSRPGLPPLDVPTLNNPTPSEV